jgi:hypothetical protein
MGLDDRPNLRRLMDHHLESRRRQRLAHRALVASGCFHTHPANLAGLQPADQSADTRLGVGEPLGFSVAADRHIELAFADIDSTDFRGGPILFHEPILVVSDPIVPATIRVSETPTVIQLPNDPKGPGTARSLRRLSAWRGDARRMSRKTSASP